jgi:hypothetical protein
MKVFTLILRPLVSFVVLCCFAFFGSQSAHASVAQPTCTTILSGSAGANDTVTVLMLGATLVDSSGSPTGNLCTSLEATQAQALGFNVEIDNDTAWQAKTQAQFATYRAIVLGDANCPNETAGATLDGPVAAAKTNKAWQPATTGPVAVVGTDPVFHSRNGSGPMGAQLTQNAIALAASIPGKPGAYICLSCYYETSGPGTLVDVLSPQFGTFTVVGRTSTTTPTNTATIASPSNALVTTPNTLTDVGLSNWGVSVHEAFDSALPPGFSEAVHSGELGLPYIITGQVQVQTPPPQTVTPGGTNQVQFVSTPNNLVEHDLIWPVNLQFNNGVTTPQLLSSNIILSTVNGIRPYLAYTPWAVAQLFEKPGDNQAANGTGFGSLYRDKCYQSGQNPSTATEQNCPIGTTPTDFINLSDVFDQPTVKPPIPPHTTVSLIHHSTPTSDVWAAVPSGATSNPVCTQVQTSGATFNCELEDDLTYDPATFATTPGGVSGDQTTIGGKKPGRGTLGSLFNVPMLETTVSVNSKPVNIPGVQGAGVNWFKPPLNLEFNVNPATTATPTNGWFAAPIQNLAYVFYSNSEPPLPDPPNCPGSTCTVKSGTPGAFDNTTGKAAPVVFMDSLTGANDGVYTLAWSARDTVQIGERNIQLLQNPPCPPDPYIPSQTNTPPCYSTTLFSAQIGVDTKPPSIVISAPAATTYAPNQVVSANYGCTDSASGVASCVGTVPSGSPINTMPAGISTAKSFTVNSTDNVGNHSLPVTVNYFVSCHYVAFALNPTTVSRGGKVNVTASMMDCTSSSQKISLKFSLTGPLGRSCSSTKTVLFTTPYFTIPAGTSRSFTFPIYIPNEACKGTFTTTTTTFISGTQVDSTSMALTVK